LVVDVRLSVRTGLQVSRELKESRLYTKSIVMTCYPSAELAVEAMKLGAIDYPIKPVAPDTLERLIKEGLLMRKDRHWTSSGLALSLGPMEDATQLLDIPQ
jgi:two-component system response regulator YesN